MRLGQKNLVYSMALAGIMLLFLVGYFIYMLPYLYVDYMMEQNLKSVREQHDSYMRRGTYEGVQVKNSTACFSVEIPMEGDYILVTGKAFSVQVSLKDERLLGILERFRERLRWKETGSEMERELEIEVEELKEILKDAAGPASSLPVEIRLLYTLDIEDEFNNESIKVHPYSEAMVVLETSVEDSSNQYVNYIAVEWGEDRLVMSYLPVVAPQLNEIRPIVLQSLPMLGTVIVLMVLLFSQMYSRGIVVPIVELADHTGQMKSAKGSFVEPLSGKWRTRKDEVGQLADTLDGFYLQIREGYQKLEEKNMELEEKNMRQEIFLQSSSHQLKTPIAAALLLVDGMMNEIGRYKDTKAYLPKVKEQLLSMRTMAEDILYLNRCEENMNFCQADVVGLMRERLHFLQAPIGKKRLSVHLSGVESLFTRTDEKLFSQILDDLLSNAIKYTPEGGRIEIRVGKGLGSRGSIRADEGSESRGSIRIENFGVTIPAKLLPHIYEPFVSGRDGDLDGVKSHGLGLYIASYYAKKLGISLTVQNGEGAGSVVAVVSLGKVVEG